MSNELATVDHGSGLSLSSEQAYWTEKQIAALRHIGVEKASEGDLTVFHHVCQRTGLDPFARQIYMIGRPTREQGPDGDWHTVIKQTIQTGIDGFRLIGRRAADRARHAVSVGAPEWAHEDGSWRPVWLKAWGNPVAARVTIKRNGEPFEAVALFEEYAQVKRNGDLTAMWTQRPAGQIAKCAEALAWRMAFPQDLSGIYTDDEMGQADNAVVVQAEQQPRRGGLGAAMANQTSGVEAAPGEEDAPVSERSPASAPEPEPREEPILLNTRSKLARAMYASINDLGIADNERIPFIVSVIDRAIESTKEMTEDEARDVLDHIQRIAEPADEETVDGEVVEDGAES